MPLQKEILDGIPAGIPGMRAAFNPAHYAGNKIVAEGVAVQAGRFVFDALPTDPEFWVKPSGESAPIGIVERNITHYDYDLKSPGTAEIQAGEEVDVLVYGDVWVESATVPERGQAVFASVTDGSVKTGAAGTEIAGYIETTWRVTRADGSNLAVITNPFHVVNNTTIIQD